MNLFKDTKVSDVICRPILNCYDELVKIRESMLTEEYEEQVHETACKNYDIVEEAMEICSKISGVKVKDFDLSYNYKFEKLPHPLAEFGHRISVIDSLKQVYNEFFSEKMREQYQEIAELFKKVNILKQKIRIQAFLIINNLIDKIRDLTNQDIEDFFCTYNEFHWQTEKIFEYITKRKTKKSADKNITVEDIQKGYPKQQKLFLW